MSLSRRYLLAALSTASLTTIVYYLHYVWSISGSPSGRTPQGRLLGILGFAAILGALFSGAQRRQRAGWLEIWHYRHLMSGSLSVLLILAHAGWHFGNIVATLAFVFLIGVATTGVFGHIVTAALTRAEERTGKPLEELGKELNAVNQELAKVVAGKSQPFRAVYQREVAAPRISLEPSWRWLFTPAEGAHDAPRPDRLRLAIKEIPGREQEDFRKLVRLFSQKETLAVSLYPQLRYAYLLRSWLSLHTALTAGLLMFSLIHLLSVLYY